MPDPTATQHTDARPAAAADDTATGGPGPAAGFPFPPPDRPGDLGRLGRYRVLKELGRGGMGAVFLGHDDQLGRRVALKVMLPQYAADPVARQRFLREARTAAAVKSEHVIDIYDVDEAGGLVYIAMRFLAGLPLDEYLRRSGRLTVPQVLRVGRETADGLAAAHATRLIHRDIKPANLWLEAPNGRVVVLDFGLAKPVADGGAELTNSGAVVGTPGYMAPEQARGRELDGRADLFSLGVVLYRLSTGVPPFPGPNVIAVLAAVLSDTPRPVWELAPDVPPPLADLIHRLLAKNPDGRPPTARDVSTALAAIEFGLARGEVSAADPVPVSDAADTPIPVEPNPEFAFDAASGPHPAARPPVRRSRVLPASLAGAALVLTAGGVAGWVATRPGPAVPTEVVAPPPTAGPATAKKADPDRALAQWVQSRGGSVTLAGGETAFRKGEPLPAGPLKVRRVHTGNADPVTDADLDRITPADQLAELYLRGTDQLTDAGLDRLTRGKFAQRLDRFSLIAPNLTDAGAAHLTRFPKLTQLGLNRAPNLSDGGLAFLRAMPDLTLLDLTDCPGFTGAGLPPAAGGGITKATFTGCTRLTDAGLAHLAGWPKLAELSVAGTAVTDAGVKRLAAVGPLAELNLSKTGVGDAGVEALADRPITSLQLSATAVTDSGVRAAARMPRLRNLNLKGASAVTDDGLAALRGCQTLRELNLTDTQVTLAGVRALRAANPACTVATRLYDDADRKAAEWVLARNGQVTAGGNVVKPGQKLPAGPFDLRAAVLDTLPPGDTLDALDIFRDCDRLTGELQLGGPVITDAAVRKLAGFLFAPGLHTLTFNKYDVTDDGLAALAGFENLKGLFLRDGKLTGRGLAVCRKLPNLTAVTVSHDKAFTDDGVKHLRGLNLVQLNIAYTAVTDAALPDISTLARLDNLFLAGTQVTDAGLPFLAGLAKLRNLSVVGTKVTGEGVCKLAAARPECRIVWDGGVLEPREK